jgi:hypothetical protein
MTRAICCATALGALLWSTGCSEASPSSGGGSALYYPEIVIVNDHSRYLDKGVMTESDSSFIMNVASGYYSNPPALGNRTVVPILVGQVTMVTADESFVRDSVNPDTGLLDYEKALAGFATYQEGLTGSLRHDVAILLTHRGGSPPNPGSPVLVELAYTGTACVPALSAAIVNVGSTQAFDASLVAHVLGHLLGMCHDPPNRGDGCATLPSTPDYSAMACESRIMAATSNPSAVNTQFSTCSAYDFESYLTHMNPTCLYLPTTVQAVTVEHTAP